LIQYLDSSSVLKIIFREEHSVSLAKYLNGVLISSDLLKVEVKRSLINRKYGELDATQELFARCHYIPISSGIISAAQNLDFGIAIRSLDAIHLASAMCLFGLDFEIVTYDQRLIDVCKLAGVIAASPS
jgi:predicted nucleic acid-binding protein